MSVARLLFASLLAVFLLALTIVVLQPPTVSENFIAAAERNADTAPAALVAVSVTDATAGEIEAPSPRSEARKVSRVPELDPLLTLLGLLLAGSVSR